MRDPLNEILGSSLSDQAWAQAQLPLSLSGLGIRSAVTHASVSFVSSSLESVNMVSELLDDPNPVLPFVDLALEHLPGVLSLRSHSSRRL